MFHLYANWIMHTGFQTGLPFYLYVPQNVFNYDLCTSNSCFTSFITTRQYTSIQCHCFILVSAVILCLKLCLVWLVFKVKYKWGTAITNRKEGALTQLEFLCRVLFILDEYKMRNVLRNILRNDCLNNPTISCWTRMTLKPHT